MPSRLQLIFLLDATLLLCICALETLSFTGLILHEWIGLAIAVMIVAHLLLSWTWIDSSARRLFSRNAGRTPTHRRINYILTVSLFACVTAQILSGALISQHAIPALTSKPAVALAANFSWDRIHHTLSNFALVLVSLHLAINWTWLAAGVRTKLGWQKAGNR